jgi:hypothetical protein
MPMAELQDVFAHYGEAYRLKHNLLSNQLKAMRAIENCRTSALGGHIDECDKCGFNRISYNSCRDRHCPKCQTLNKERWIDARKDDLLNVGYFHVVFTIPDDLNPVAYQNPKIVYDILFKAVAETLSELSADKKYLGAQTGFTEILHTWGQNLSHHPHIHCIVPGGGLNACGQWVIARKKFFLPVKVLSRKFRGKFLFYFKQAALEFHNSIYYLNDQSAFNHFLSVLYEKDWVVYCKPPFKTAGHVVEYLGRYTHRVAISNNRIIRLHDGKVTFSWRDYRDSNRQKLMDLTADEFIRRFLIHVLPKKFTKIRHYGLLSPRVKTVRLKLCKKLTSTPIREKPPVRISAVELLQKITGRDFTICPCCGVGHLSRASPVKASNI